MAEQSAASADGVERVEIEPLLLQRLQNQCFAIGHLIGNAFKARKLLCAVIDGDAKDLVFLIEDRDLGGRCARIDDQYLHGLHRVEARVIRL